MLDLLVRALDSARHVDGRCTRFNRPVIGTPDCARRSRDRE
jgi:hypothetical protein